MRVLITGGAGYLGTVLVRDLLTLTAYQVRVLDRFSFGTQPICSVATSSALEVYAGDIRSAWDLDKALHQVDAIIHLAAIVGYPACDADPEDADTTNVDGTRLLCEQADGRPILFASTGSCYGTHAGLADESTPISPLTRYGRTKAEGERLVLDVGGIVLRFATLYGLSPRMRWDLLPNDFAKRGVQQHELRVYDPQARRPFLHVEDAATALRYLLAAARHATAPTGIYNIGCDTLNLTKEAVAQEVERLTHCTVTTVEGTDPDGRDYAASYEKIQRLGWQPWHPTFRLDQVVEMAKVWR